jgi:sensor histidine kinase regulating citrate/malate metabolism
VVICNAHELIQSGNRHCKKINEAYKLISKKRITRNQKIETIENYFNKVADETLAQLLIDKYEREYSGQTQSKG